MSENVLSDITSYTDFLRKCGYAVSLCCFDRVFSRYLPILKEYEVHTPTLCAYLKSNPKTRRLCPDNKERLRSKNVSGMYYGCCIAGVEEYVVPIFSGEKLIACVNVTGFRGKLAESQRQKKIISHYCGEEFLKLYDLLSTEIPDEKTVHSITQPFGYMFKVLYEQCVKFPVEDSPSEKMYYSALNFIYNNYMNDVSAADVACHVNYSESYLRHIFLKMSGKTVGAFLCDVRLSNARLLLENTDFTVTRIASDCGFGDPNYFSVLFRKKYGTPPKRYGKDRRS